MEEKLYRANENIKELVDSIVYHKTQNYDHCCLRVVLLNKERCRCGDDDMSCDECNRKAKAEYRDKLLSHYLVE